MAIIYHSENNYAKSDHIYFLINKHLNNNFQLSFPSFVQKKSRILAFILLWTVRCVARDFYSQSCRFELVPIANQFDQPLFLVRFPLFLPPPPPPFYFFHRPTFSLSVVFGMPQRRAAIGVTNSVNRASNSRAENPRCGQQPGYEAEVALAVTPVVPGDLPFDNRRESGGKSVISRWIGTRSRRGAASRFLLAVSISSPDLTPDRPRITISPSIMYTPPPPPPSPPPPPHLCSS